MVYIKKSREDTRVHNYQERTKSMVLPDENDATLTEPSVWEFVICPPPTGIPSAYCQYELRCQHPKYKGFKFEYVIDNVDIEKFGGDDRAHAEYFKHYLFQSLELKFEDMKKRATKKIEMANNMAELALLKASHPEMFQNPFSR